MQDLKKGVAIKRQDDETDKVKQAVNELEWQSRRFNLEISSSPLSQIKDLMMKVNDVAARLAVAQLSATDVAGPHRVPSKPDMFSGIIIRFTREANKGRMAGQKNNFKRSETEMQVLRK